MLNLFGQKSLGMRVSRLLMKVCSLLLKLVVVVPASDPYSAMVSTFGVEDLERGLQ